MPNIDEVQRHAELVAAQGRFLGGPVDTYAVSGRRILRQAIKHGLERHSLVIDVGCGALRGGIWLIDHLDPGRYCGIEPSDAFLATGSSIARAVLGDDFELRKRPRFDDNDRFDLSVFRERPDVVVASGIFNHAAKRHIGMLLDSFADVAHPETVLLATFRIASSAQTDYDGDSWKGRSHERDEPGMVRHRPSSLARLASDRGLALTDLGQFDDKGPRWLRVTPK